MSNVLFILGAGASAAGGCPVMGNFLARARQLASTNPSSRLAGSYQQVLQVQQVLQRAQAKSTIDYDNIESLFSAIEMAELLGGFPDFGESRFAKSKAALLQLIADTIDASQAISGTRTTNTKCPLTCAGPVDAKELTNWILSMTDQPYRHRVSVVSFNYDIGLDLSLLSTGFSIDYCLDRTQSHIESRVQTNRPLVRLLKLHGSLNWVREATASGGSRISFFNPYDLAINQFLGDPSRTVLDTSEGRAPLANGKGDALPFIVPPGESKSGYRDLIRNVWANAFEAIQTAEVVVIAGYSLPATDTFFNQLFALGMASDAIVRKVHIVNPDSQARNRLSSLLGPAIRNRNDILETSPGTLLEFVQWWKGLAVPAY